MFRDEYCRSYTILLPNAGYTAVAVRLRKKRD